mmetsp:Transcript_4396/g.6509  ORF Transcript_4396/g.6509 Transcript_4396/m.6509 type:complete len:86 (+) Transcript_4396:2152-2409(+)
MRYYGIHEPDQEKREAKVGCHLAPFGDGPSYNGTHGAREGKLEKPKGIVDGVGPGKVPSEKRVPPANKGPWAVGVISAIGKRVTG